MCDYKDEEDPKRAINGEIDLFINKDNKPLELDEDECVRLESVFENFLSSLDSPDIYEIVKGFFKDVKSIIGKNFVTFHVQFIPFIDSFFDKYQTEQPNNLHKFMNVFYRIHKSDDVLDYLEEKSVALLELINYFLSFNSPDLKKVIEICLTYVRHVEDYSILTSLNESYLFERLEDRLGDFEIVPSLFLILKAIAMTTISEEYVIALTDFVSHLSYLYQDNLKSLTNIIMMVIHNELFDDSPLYHFFFDAKECPPFIDENISAFGLKYIGKILLELNDIQNGYITIAPIEKIYDALVEILINFQSDKVCGFGLAFHIINKYFEHDTSFLQNNLVALQEMLFQNKDLMPYNEIEPAVSCAVTLFHEQICSNDTSFDYSIYIDLFLDYIQVLNAEELPKIAIDVLSLYEKLEFTKDTEGMDAVESSGLIGAIIDACEEAEVDENLVQSFLRKFSSEEEEK